MGERAAAAARLPLSRMARFRGGSGVGGRQGRRWLARALGLALLLQLLVTPSPAEALGWRLPGQGAAAPSRPGGERARRQLQEVPPPAWVQQAREALEERDPRVRILAPADGDLLPDGPWTLRLQVTDWPLVEAGPLGLGPHLVVQLDGEPPRPVVDTAVEMPPLSPGSHRLTVYAAKPWGEAHKSPLAFQQIRLHRLAANPATLPAPGTPQLIPVSPAGLAGDPPLLLDWLLIDAPLQGLRGDTSGWRLRLTVNGESVLVDQQTPLWLQGWKPGSNALLLELLDGRGEPLNPPFNSLLQDVIVPEAGAGGSLRARSAPTTDLERAVLLGEQPVSVLFPAAPVSPATAEVPASPEVTATLETLASPKVPDTSKAPVTPGGGPVSPGVPMTPQGPDSPDGGPPSVAPAVSALSISEPAPPPGPGSEPSEPASLVPGEALDRKGLPTAPKPPSGPTAPSAAPNPDAQGTAARFPATVAPAPESAASPSGDPTANPTVDPSAKPLAGAPSASTPAVPAAEAPAIAAAPPADVIHPSSAAVPPAPVVPAPEPPPAPAPAPSRSAPSEPAPAPSALAPTAPAPGTTAGFSPGAAAGDRAEDTTSPAEPPATAALPPAAAGPSAPPLPPSAFAPSMPPVPPATDPPMAARAEVNVDGTLRRPARPNLVQQLRERLGR